MASWVIGDIHGCAKTLEALLSLLPVQDEIIPVGDLFSKGPDAQGVLEILKPITTSIILGNHDIEWIKKLNYGSLNTSFQPQVEWLKEHGRFVLERDSKLIVHAGLLARWDIEFLKAATYQDYENSKVPGEIVEMRLLYGKPWYKALPNDFQHVIFGHWAEHGYKSTSRATCIDSGCVYGRSLTAIRTSDLTIVQVPCLDTW